MQLVLRWKTEIHVPTNAKKECIKIKIKSVKNVIASALNAMDPKNPIVPDVLTDITLKPKPVKNVTSTV